MIPISFEQARIPNLPASVAPTPLADRVLVGGSLLHLKATILYLLQELLRVDAKAGRRNQRVQQGQHQTHQVYLFDTVHFLCEYVFDILHHTPLDVSPPDNRAIPLRRAEPSLE